MILLFWATLINIGQHQTTQINIDQHLSPLIHSDQPWSTLITTSVEQHWSILTSNDQHGSTWINTGQHRWTLINTVDIDQHWSILSNTDQHWPTLIITGEHWLNTASYPIPFHHIPSSLLCVHQMSRNPHTGFWKLRNLLAPSYPLWTDPLILPILPILQSCNHLTIQTSWFGTAECASRLRLIDWLTN